MQLGVMANGIAALGWDRALDYCRQLGLDAIEVPCGLYPKHHLIDAAAVLDSTTQQQQIKDDLARRGLTLSALGCSGNPVHPDPDQAGRFDQAHDLVVRLAARLGVDTVIAFSGCPGGGPDDRTPNWITCPWPGEFERMTAYQWDDVLVPYWRRKAAEARDLGVRIALEMHPGFCVYNPETLLKLRRLTGDNVGCNFDPSHLFWQGIDPVEAARVIGEAGAIYHVHAKDTAVNHQHTRVHGVLDAKGYGDVLHRAWVFRACGYGHGDEFWKPFVTMLRLVGYDGVLSIEHEDSTMSWQEGFKKAVDYLRGVVLREPAGAAWWF